ncbi:MAG: PAS domain S-box protein [Chitinispirillaceae bacterium]|nr:PAS domain S-box protein [Chitinispirillaceae bacterium]
MKETIALSNMSSEEARQYAENIADTVRNALLVLDGNLRVRSANRSFYQQFKVTAAETENHLIFELGNGQWDIPDLRRLLEKIILEKITIEDFEVQHRFEQIGERVMRLNARRIQREQGQPRLILLAIEDITESFAVHHALQKSEKKYHKFVEEINSVIISFDQRGRITFFNRCSEKLFGYCRDEAIGKPFVGTVIPLVDSSGNDNSDLTEKMISNPEKYYEYECETRRRDGSVIWISWNAKEERDVNGAVSEIIIDGNDITELKKIRQRNQEELKRSEQRLQRALGIETLGVHFFDMKNTFTGANDAFLRMIGHDRQALERGELRSDCVTSAEWMPRTWQAFEELKTTGRFSPYEKELIRPDGSRWWGLFAGTRLGENEAVEFVIDITDRKLGEKALQRRTEELASSNRSLEAFSYSVSHDLRNPLHTIGSFADFLIDDYSERLDEEGRNYLRRIVSGVKKMQVLIDDMLNLSRLGRQDMKREDTNLSDIVRDYLQELKTTEPARQTEFVIQDNLHAKADKRMTHLALENLLRNAWKFTSKREVTRIEFGSIVKDNQIVYFVRDNGVGFNMQCAGRIFEPFKRVHAENEFAGTGVGLSIVHQVVERHDGKVWAEGETGKGATFYFTIG